MNAYLIDHTRDHLVAAAEHASYKEVGDLRIQILATRDTVMVRACLGGVHKTWISDSCHWEKLAREAVNPLIAIIDGVLFRAERQAALVSGRESGQQPPS